MRKNAPIYMDYNATAPIRDGAKAAILEALAVSGNPSSVHAAGREARKIVERARGEVAALVSARPQDVVFMGSGTEANNAALRSTVARRLLISGVEHESVLAAAQASLLEVVVIPVGADGIVDLDFIAQEAARQPEQTLVSVMMANNETGVIQPVAEIAQIVHAAGARFHTDAVQIVGKMPVNAAEVGADYMSLSAHKLGGPQGVGALILSPTAPLRPLVAGGGQELGRRSGTENVSGIAGFGAAASAAMADALAADRLSALRDRLEQHALALAPSARVVGADGPRNPVTTCLLLPGVRGETQVMHFDLGGVCLSSGSACSSGKVKISHVLSAMGVPRDEAECSIRVSIGYETTDDDVDGFLSVWEDLVTRQAGRRAMV